MRASVRLRCARNGVDGKPRGSAVAVAARRSAAKQAKRPGLCSEPQGSGWPQAPYHFPMLDEV